MRFHLRWSGTVGRWIAPGPKTSGMPAAISARTIERIPAMPAPRRRLVGALEHHQRELALADLRGRDEREPVPGGTEHEIEGRVGAERVDQRRRVGAELRGGEALLQQRQPAVERADLEGDGAGIDAGDARARGQASSSFAISYTPSTSRIASLDSNSRRTHALWTFIFGPPIASAPSTRLPS